MDIPSEIMERDQIIKKYAQLVDILYDHIREIRKEQSNHVGDDVATMVNFFAGHQERIFNRIEEHELLMEAITSIYGKKGVQTEAKKECCQASNKECCQNSKTTKNNDSTASQQESKREIPQYKKALCKKWPPDYMTGVSCGCLGNFKLLGVANEWNVDYRENVYFLECTCGIRAKIENGIFYVLIDQHGTGKILC